MEKPLFDYLPLWSFALLVLMLACGGVEAGYRYGRRRQARAEKEGPIGAIVAAILALMAFMFAFTFSLAASRFESRRQTALDEANAIGTTYLRTRMLPEPERSNTAKLLREYVDLRLVGNDPDTVKRAIAKSEQLHAEIWNHAAAAAEKSPTVITGLFVQSLNETIDLHAKRMFAGIRSRVPLAVWLELFGLTFIGMASVGYLVGISGMQRSPAMWALALAFASVLYLIADIDRPTEGIFTTHQHVLLDLQKSMQAPQP